MSTGFFLDADATVGFECQCLERFQGRLNTNSGMLEMFGRLKGLVRDYHWMVVRHWGGATGIVLDHHSRLLTPKSLLRLKSDFLAVAPAQLATKVES